MYKVKQHKKPVTFFEALKDLVLGLSKHKPENPVINYWDEWFNFFFI